MARRQTSSASLVRISTSSGIVRVKKKTIYGLSPERLARILALAARPGDSAKSSPSEPTPAEVLQGILSAGPPLDPSAPNSLPTILDWPCREVLTAARRKIGELLLDPETDLEILRALKEYGKTLAGRRRTESQQIAATAIYYAAIASALVFHDRRITRLSCQKLHEAFTRLEGEQWVPSELKDLLRRAGAECRQEIEDQQ